MLQLKTADGLALGLDGGRIVSMKAGGRELAGNESGGFGVYDMAGGACRLNFDPLPASAKQPLVLRSRCAEADLDLETCFTAGPSCIHVRGRLSDRRGSDRAVRLVFSLPLDARTWEWGDDIRRKRTIGGGVYENVEPVAAGSGAFSIYPLAVVWNGKCGLAMGLDLTRPAPYSLRYESGEGLCIRYDFGLSRETKRFPGAAEFAFVVFLCDPRWEFRSACDKYMRLFPSAYEVRSRDQGVWMPFTAISSVAGWEDFGFRYHEGGNDDHAFDRQHGLLPFHYSEPLTWWMPMPADMPRSYEAARAEHRRLLLKGTKRQRRMAAAMERSAMTDGEGRWVVSFHDLPWCNGAVWAMNPNPAQGGHVNGATVHWSGRIAARRHGPDSLLAGEYLDSVEGYTTPDLNYRRDHFRYTTVPLTFSPNNNVPALFKGLAVFEFARKLSEDMRSMGKLLFGNGVPYRFPWLASLFDVMGTETVWLDEQDRYAPPPDAQMCLWRTLAGAKPYLLLQNTRFKAFNSDMVEKYFQRSLFYGMYPGMFSVDAATDPYWADSDLYNRDRSTFRRYQPLIRQVAEAGWQPVTRAGMDNPSILVERFGSAGCVYLTLMNQTETEQRGSLTVENRIVAPAMELVAGKPLLPASDGGFPIKLRPDETQVLRLYPG